jgi:hypothetical protein
LLRSLAGSKLFCSVLPYGFIPNAYQIAGGLVALSGVVYMQWRKLQTTKR